ncbi:hypothetical protein CDD82_4371 [Ophiocordyceps australis]|uniref:Uncharacterized protein n=1 Tax=Ophiocordyceps australis TaxID=1399860 RepID=A0A2C5Z7C4_9HYPO|nr:hypothetical protein CDD82_4371 [Ophiocordyceps australis]
MNGISAIIVFIMLGLNGMVVFVLLLVGLVGLALYNTIQLFIDADDGLYPRRRGLLWREAESRNGGLFYLDQRTGCWQHREKGLGVGADGFIFPRRPSGTEGCVYASKRGEAETFQGVLLY